MHASCLLSSLVQRRLDCHTDHVSENSLLRYSGGSPPRFAFGRRHRLVSVLLNGCAVVRLRANHHLVFQVAFTISPASLENLKDRKAVPDFLVEGRLISSVCSITKPFVGEITVVRADAPVKSIELQVRSPCLLGCCRPSPRPQSPGHPQHSVDEPTVVALSR